mmetsp:Transcript_10729/g.28703  ORF Transcript_10729/g.28703 Transcript_10729/m.28703 type:complete len:152 (+) Transcript_10729:861-1316(+)
MVLGFRVHEDKCDAHDLTRLETNIRRARFNCLSKLVCRDGRFVPLAKELTRMFRCNIDPHESAGATFAPIYRRRPRRTQRVQNSTFYSVLARGSRENVSSNASALSCCMDGNPFARSVSQTVFAPKATKSNNETNCNTTWVVARLRIKRGF